MALKLEMNSTEFESLAPELKPMYKLQDGGVHRLDVEGGVVPKAKLEEFRENNIALLKKIDPIKEWSAEDVVEAKAALDEKRKKKAKGKDVDEDEVETRVNERVVEMRTNFETQTKAERERREAAEGFLSVLLVDNELSRAALESGALDTAVDDIVRRGRDIFRVGQDRKVLPYDGDKVIYGEDGVTPLTVKQWLTKLSTKAPHLFKTSKGGGADGGNLGGGGSGTVTKKSDLKTAKDKAQYIGKNGRDAYLKLPQ